VQIYTKFQYKRFILDFMEKIFLTDTPSAKIFKSPKRKIWGVKCKVPVFNINFFLYSKKRKELQKSI